jgi:hypothetical protein
MLAGAKVWYNGQFHTVADPLRHFVDGLLSLTNPIGSVVDKVNVGVFRLKTLIGPLDAIFEKPETTILERLRVGLRLAVVDAGCWVAGVEAWQALSVALSAAISSSWCRQR